MAENSSQMAGGLEYLHPFQALRYSSYAQAINDYIYVFSDQSRIFFQKKRQGILREVGPLDLSIAILAS